MIPNAWQGFDFGLGEDIDMLRETTRSFADDKIAPRADEIDKTNTFPRDLWPQMGALGLLGVTVEEECGGAGHGLSRPLRGDGGNLARLGLGRPVLRRALQSLRQPDPPQRQRRTAPQISAEADLRRARRRAGDVGARRRLRRRVDAHPRRQEGRPLRPQRHENVDHQRPGGRDARGLRQDRPGRRRARHHRLHDREGHEGIFHRARSSTSSACAAPTPASWCFRIARCRRRTCWARSATASTC